MIMERYDRHIRLAEIGQNGQEKINRARVLVVGAGGLGCPVLQYLAGAGVGTIGVIDFDLVEVSNLHRQVLFGQSDLGTNKALAAKKRLADLNPTITIAAYPERLEASNVIDLFKKYDLLVDATDDIATRYLINDAALMLDKTVIYGALYKFEGQVAVFNHQNGPTYRCLFPKPPSLESVASCSDIGVLGVLPGIIGCMQANEVLKLILGLGVLSGKLLYYNALKAQSTIMTLPNNSHKMRLKLKQQGFVSGSNHSQCDHAVKTITLQSAFKLAEARFVDVRNADELPAVTFPGCVQIPMDQLSTRIEELREPVPYVFFCASGIRSHHAIQMVQEKLTGEYYNLSAGAAALAQYRNNEL